MSVVNNEYLPLTDDEFDIIRLHPRLGEIFLRAVPGLEIFHDTTVGHHKWYNGKGDILLILIIRNRRFVF